MIGTKIYKLPSWFYKIGLFNVGYPTIDHLRTIKNSQGFLEVESRPYSISQHQIENICCICKVNKICFEITAKNEYSSDALLLRFWKKDDEEFYEQSEDSKEIWKKMEEQNGTKN
jgi:hypothetical protein